MKKYIAGLAAVLLAALGGITLTPSPASAHTGDLDASAVCQDDGTYLVTYKLTLSSVPAGNTGDIWWRIGTTSFEGTPSNHNGMNHWGTKAGNGTVTLGTKTLPGNSTQAPWAYAFTTWSPDNFSKGSDGGDISLAGNCKPKLTKDSSFTKSVSDADCQTGQTLTYSGSNVTFSGPASGTTGPSTGVSVTATPTSGHAWSDGTTTTRTVFSGDLSGPNDPDGDGCASKTATADVEVTGPSCDTAGSASVKGLLHATLVGALDQTPGTHTAQFKADAGYRFADGSKTKDVTYTIAPKTDGDSDACAAKDAAADVAVTPATCDAPGTASVTGLSHATLTGTLNQTPGQHTASFTADAGHRFSDGSKTRDVNYTIPPKLTDCTTPPTKVTPASVSTTGADCDTAGSLTIPAQPTGVKVTPNPGTYGPGEYDVVFSAESGYELTSNPSGHFSVPTKSKGEDCKPDKPKKPDTPRKPDVPTKINAGLPGTPEQTSGSNPWPYGLLTFLGLGGITAAAVRRKLAK